MATGHTQGHTNPREPFNMPMPDTGRWQRLEASEQWRSQGTRGVSPMEFLRVYLFVFQELVRSSQPKIIGRSMLCEVIFGWFNDFKLIPSHLVFWGNEAWHVDRAKLLLSATALRSPPVHRSLQHTARSLLGHRWPFRTWPFVKMNHQNQQMNHP